MTPSHEGDEEDFRNGSDQGRTMDEPSQGENEAHAVMMDGAVISAPPRNSQTRPKRNTGRALLEEKFARYSNGTSTDGPSAESPSTQHTRRSTQPPSRNSGRTRLEEKFNRNPETTSSGDDKPRLRLSPAVDRTVTKNAGTGQQQVVVNTSAPTRDPMDVPPTKPSRGSGKSAMRNNQQGVLPASGSNTSEVLRRITGRAQLEEKFNRSSQNTQTRRLEKGRVQGRRKKGSANSNPSLGSSWSSSSSNGEPFLVKLSPAVDPSVTKSSAGNGQPVADNRAAATPGAIRVGDVGSDNDDDSRANNTDVAAHDTQDIENESPLLEAEKAPDVDSFPQAAIVTEEPKIWGIPKKRCKLLFLALLAIIGITVGVSVGLSDDGDGTVLVITDIPTATPSVSPSGIPTLSKAVRLAEILLPEGMDLTELDEESAQYSALEWLAYEDPLDLPAEDSAELQERYALAVFYNSTIGSKWADNDRWLSGNSVCNWTRISCDLESRVTDMTLAQNLVGGTVPMELAKLSMLTNLQLGLNLFTETVPSELGALTALENLSLYFNSFSGMIPTEIGSLTGLTGLDLSFNSLTGSLPSELGAMTGMTALNLSFNSFSGKLPSEIGAMKALPLLSLNSNAFTGTLPSEIGSLTALSAASIMGSSFTGMLPSEIGSLTNLSTLSLAFNSFSGGIPSAFGFLTRLRWLDLSSNSLSGSLPSEIGFMTDLRQLSLGSNVVSGMLPSELGSLTGLTGLDMKNNNALTGAVPSELDFLTRMKRASFQNTSFVGGTDTLFCNAVNLTLFQADCGGSPPEVVCSCCTSCVRR